MVGVGIIWLKIIYQDIILFICYYIDKIILFFYGMGVRISVLYVKNWQTCPILCAKKVEKMADFCGFQVVLGLRTDGFYAKQSYSVVLDA